MGDSVEWGDTVGDSVEWGILWVTVLSGGYCG